MNTASKCLCPESKQVTSHLTLWLSLRAHVSRWLPSCIWLGMCTAICIFLLYFGLQVWSLWEYEHEKGRVPPGKALNNSRPQRWAFEQGFLEKNKSLLGPTCETPEHLWVTSKTVAWTIINHWYLHKYNGRVIGQKQIRCKPLYSWGEREKHAEPTVNLKK